MINLNQVKIDFLKYFKVIVWYIPFLIIFLLANRESKKLSIKHCEEFKQEEYHGRVLKKYIDLKQHNYKMLVVLIDSNMVSLNYTLEESGFWDFVQINDSIIKRKGNNEIYVVNKDTSFSINCLHVVKKN
jgi:hypothetical protein